MPFFSFSFLVSLVISIANALQTAAVLALTEVRGEDKGDLAKLVTAVKEGYLEKYEESKRHWGGGIMGAKANAKIGEFSSHRGLFWHKTTDPYFSSLQPKSRRRWMRLSKSNCFPSLMCKIKIKISWVPFSIAWCLGNWKSRDLLLYLSSIKYYSFLSLEK